ncbi:hypothetical protein G6F58_013892 [Rhizopus delemar]|nr:hypothetical protein G6F58_013892 [Rhizopus delemar]
MHEKFGLDGRVHFNVGGAQAIEDSLKIAATTGAPWVPRRSPPATATAAATVISASARCSSRSRTPSAARRA